MPTVRRLFNDRHFFPDASGNNALAGGKLFIYLAGSTTKSTSYNSSLGTVPNANPLVLSAAGLLQSEVWVVTGINYKLVLTTSGDTDPPLAPIWTEDVIQGINDFPSNSITGEFVALTSGGIVVVPTYISATSFSVPGDQTAVLQAGRRLQIVDAGGTKYGTILSSVFSGGVTTITLDANSNALANPVSSVSYGLISVVNTSLPFIQTTGVLALNKTIYGFTYANNVADAVNDIDIASGGGIDATGVYWMTVGALTKRLDASWAVGTNQGGLDTGVVGNSDYYIWAIARSDLGITDYLFSLSSTAPTMPANYNFKRLIGWFKRVGGTIVAFHTYETEGGGLELLWDVPTSDILLNNTLGTARRTDAVKVPLNFSTIARLGVTLADAAVTFTAWITCPDHTDGTAATWYNFASQVAGSITAAAELRVRTSSAGLIAARASIATVDVYLVQTFGFTWARR